MANAPIDPNRSALVVFDMLNGFVNSNNRVRTEVARSDNRAVPPDAR